MSAMLAIGTSTAELELYERNDLQSPERGRTDR